MAELDPKRLAEIEAEEKARAEIRARLNKQTPPPKKGGIGCGGAILFVALFAIVIGALNANNNPSSKSVAPSSTPAKATTMPAPTPKPLTEKQKHCDGVQLVLESWRWEQDTDSFVTATGEVTNVSGEKLSNVSAVVSFYTAADQIITKEDALIDYNPILNTQKSSFKVIATYNPEMKHASLQLKTLFGSGLSTITRADWNKYKCGNN